MIVAIEGNKIGIMIEEFITERREECIGHEEELILILFFSSNLSNVR